MDAIIKEAADDFRDSVATMDKDGKRIWINPQKPKGKLYNARNIVAVVLLTLMIVMPFIKVKGEQFFLFNILERKFVLFGVPFYTQDFFLFGLTMVTLMVFIVLFTVAFGRLWCGWACPHTIFMEMVFRKIEYLFEGDSSSQRALNKSAWNGNKIARRGGKLAVFGIMAIFLSLVFHSYIVGVEKVLALFSANGPVGMWTTVVLFGSAVFFVFAWFREQACIVVCPYGRLQGVLLDKNSIMVAYDYLRGEPRGKFRKDKGSLGDCLDCGQCVKVCPTGIDIRHGTQMECVNCTACIDACDYMMEKTGRPKGLIRFASENNIRQGQKLTLTLRLAGYAAVLLVLVMTLSFALYKRKPVSVTVLRTPGMMYQEQGKDSVSNLYHVKLVNKSAFPVKASLRCENDAVLKMIGKDTMVLAKGEKGEGEFFLVMNRKDLDGRKTNLKLVIYDGQKELQEVETVFVGPGKR